MHLLKVDAGGLSFGCLRAKDMGGRDAAIVIYESLRRPRTFRMLQQGELVLCDHIHSSVFHPCAVVNESHLCLRRLDLPSDVTASYFPLFEPIDRPA